MENQKQHIMYVVLKLENDKEVKMFKCLFDIKSLYGVGIINDIDSCMSWLSKYKNEEKCIYGLMKDNIGVTTVVSTGEELVFLSREMIMDYVNEVTPMKIKDTHDIMEMLMSSYLTYFNITYVENTIYNASTPITDVTYSERINSLIEKLPHEGDKPSAIFLNDNEPYIVFKEFIRIEEYSDILNYVVDHIDELGSDVKDGGNGIFIHISTYVKVVEILYGLESTLLLELYTALNMFVNETNTGEKV